VKNFIETVTEMIPKLNINITAWRGMVDPKTCLFSRLDIMPDLFVLIKTV